jgi:S1-C subfamily serine protease
MISAHAMLELVIEHTRGPLSGRSTRFPADKLRVTVGRDLRCDIAYPETTLEVGIEHLDLLRDAGHYEVRVNSADLVLVNGQRASDGWELAEGDELVLGNERGPALRVRYENRREAGRPGAGGARMADDARRLHGLHRRQQLLVGALIGLGALAGWGFVRAWNAEHELRTQVEAAQSAADFAASSNPESASFAGAIAGAMPSVYLVLSKKDEVGEAPLGTAWVVAPGALATNAHVAEVFDELAGSDDAERRLVVRSAREPHAEFEIIAVELHPAYRPFAEVWEEYAPTLIDDRGQARQMDLIPGYDVALMRVAADADLGPALPRAAETVLTALGPGDPIAYVGFPTENLVDWDYTRPNPTSQVANVVALATFTRTKPIGEPGYLLEHSLPVTGGASGSPIFDARGRVVAILSAQNAVDVPFAGRAPSAALVNYAQRVDVLDALLDGSAVPLDALRASWKRDLARYSSREKATARIVRGNLAQWLGEYGGSDPSKLIATSDAIGADDRTEDVPGKRYTVDGKPGHYLAVAVSQAGRDIDATVLAFQGGDTVEIGKDDRTDHYPMVAFDLEQSRPLAIDVFDASFEPTPRRPTSGYDLTLYYVPPATGD